MTEKRVSRCMHERGLDRGNMVLRGGNAHRVHAVSAACISPLRGMWCEVRLQSWPAAQRMPTRQLVCDRADSSAALRAAFTFMSPTPRRS
jgi:hypothetical protein